MMNPKTPRIIVVGEILFDLISGQKHLGGAPFNFAYHMLKFGFSIRFISRVGQDDNGKEILKRLDSLNFPVADIQSDPALDSGTVQVDLDSTGSPRFDIAAPAAYDHIEFMKNVHLPMVDAADCLYFGSLAQRRAKGRFHVQQFLQHMRPAGIRFYDINLRPDCYTEKAIKQSLTHTTILKLNIDELETCKQMFDSPVADDPFVRHLMERFKISQVILTKGSDGSTLYAEKGMLHSHPAPVKTMSDSVGAGDAFAAMFCACTLKKQDPAQALFTASDFASRICEISGAIPPSDAFYTPYQTLIDRRSLHEVV